MRSSFRDPEGRVFFYRDRVFRAVTSAVIENVLQHSAAQRTAIIPTRVLCENESAELLRSARNEGYSLPEHFNRVLEHEKVAFVSYPHEWPAEMLFQAAKLTIELAVELAGSGSKLKDGTPYNVLYNGPEPVQVDVLSIEKRPAGDTRWLALAQFSRTFLLPLLLRKHFGIDTARTLLHNREGPTPEDVYKMCSALQRLRPGILGLVSLPTWFGGDNKQPALFEPSRNGNAERAAFIFSSMLKRTRRQLEALEPQSPSSSWTDYAESCHYDASSSAQKEQFVSKTLGAARPSWVLDVGCNTGNFSRLAAQLGANVVAIDSDPAVTGRVWRMAHEQRLSILPLTVDLASPTPPVGWRNQECLSFLERASGRFDAVLMLAVLHHLLVSARIPLDQVLRLASELCTAVLILEYVPPSDPMFKRIARGRDELHSDLSSDLLERIAGQFFHLREKCQLPNGRVLYAFAKKDP